MLKTIAKVYWFGRKHAVSPSRKVEVTAKTVEAPPDFVGGDARNFPKDYINGYQR